MEDARPNISPELSEPQPTWRFPTSVSSLGYRDYSLYFIGMIISFMGSWMQMVALGWLVYDLTRSPLYLGYVTFAATAPQFIFSLPAGVLADRFSKRRITICTQTLAMIQAGVLGALALTNHIQVWHIFVLAIAGGIINAFDVPARHSMTSELVARRHLMNAVALNSISFNGARILGPALAGIIVAKYGTPMCFIVNSISYVAALAGLIMMRTRFTGNSSEEKMLSQITEGLRYIWRSPIQRDLLMMTLLLSTFGSQFITQMPAFARQILHAGATKFGMLMSAVGVGAVLASIVVASYGHRFKAGKIVMFGSVIFPVGLMIFGVVHSYLLALLCLVMVGFGMMMFLAVSNSLIQLMAPDDLRGRVIAVRSLVFFGVAPPIGGLLFATAAEYLGLREAMLFGGAVSLIVAIFYRRVAQYQES